MRFAEFKKAVQAEFEECLKKFPELQNIKLIIEERAKLSGGEGKLGNIRFVILFVPPALFDEPKALRPLIFHELSHMIDKENPDRVFYARADEQSQKLWQLIQQAGTLNCIVEE
jgi:ABC-type branched-subunit amino acid transport system ATPase component